MKHIQFEEWLVLSFYDELSETEQALLNEHLSTCERCRKEQEEIKTLHGTLAHRRLAFPQDSMLQTARRELRLRIAEKVASPSLREKILGTIDRFVGLRVQVAFGAVVTLAVGILIGYIFFNHSSSGVLTQSGFSTAAAVDAAESQVTNLRFLERDPQSGNIEFRFEAVTPMYIRGNLNDERVQKVLARAMISDQNAGTRLRAVNMLGNQNESSPSLTRSLDAEVKKALITALLDDKNLGVRKEALGVLRRHLPDPDITRAFLNVLANEKNIGIKIAAINSLDVTKSDDAGMNNEILAILKHKAQSDDNNYIRIRAKAALQEVQQ
jgi:hypothetical protein